MTVWFAGNDITFDYSAIRPQGARLLIKGGRASGPGPLKELLDFTRDKVLSRQKRHLSSLDCYDIATKCGWVVQCGGTRRSAEISLSDLDDDEMRESKSGQFWQQNPHRATANNSAVYEEKPGSVDFLREWLSLAESGSGERGIFNRGALPGQIPKRRKKCKSFGVNPCGEIILRPRQFCNLSIAVARPGDTVDDLKRKVRLAAILGTAQSCLTDFHYISDEWRENCEEERLLGVDITGQVDCEILRSGGEGIPELLEELKKVVIDTNIEFAAKTGIGEAKAATAVKPSGNSSQLLSCSSGMHPRYAKHYIRRVRAGSYTPIAQLLKDVGVPWSYEVGHNSESATVLVFDFIVESPKGAITREDMTALEQLENWKVWKNSYTEHNPSQTVYVRENEWLEAGAWVYENWDIIGGLTFLPYDTGVYQLAPYEQISEKDFSRKYKSFPEINWAKLSRYESEDMTEMGREFACAGGSCEF
jgi:ribonucleoside-diphosphate reductase alpha chain